MKRCEILIIALLAAALLTLTAACNKSGEAKGPSISSAPFGQTAEGQAVELYTLKNSRGTTVRITPWGGVVTSIIVPDRSGTMGDVVHGFDELAGYTDAVPYFGALIGRYGNRIAKGAFELDGTVYTLPVNNGANHLHGGPKGFDKVLMPASLFFSSIPAFGMAVTLLVIFGVNMKVAPISGGYAFDMIPNLSWRFIGSVISHYQLPFWSIVLVAIGGQAVGMRSMSIYELNSDYVKFSRFMGIKDRKIVGQQAYFR